jgi:hypothetical protein
MPVRQMGIYIKDMLNFAISGEDIRTMISENRLIYCGHEEVHTFLNPRFLEEPLCLEAWCL